MSKRGGRSSNRRQAEVIGTSACKQLCEQACRKVGVEVCGQRSRQAGEKTRREAGIRQSRYAYKRPRNGKIGTQRNEKGENQVRRQEAHE